MEESLIKTAKREGHILRHRYIWHAALSVLGRKMLVVHKKNLEWILRLEAKICTLAAHDGQRLCRFSLPS
jgi:hypothetical protein